MPTILLIALRLGGAIYLAWLAWQCVRPGGQPLFAPRPMPREGALRLFSIGFATAALNPKVALFYMAVLPPFLDPERGGAEGRAGDDGGHGGVQLAWVVCEKWVACVAGAVVRC